MHPRVVRQTSVEGCFTLPIGVTFLDRKVGDSPKMLRISTVCLEGGHLEDPLHWSEPEHGYETMIFLEGCTFFSLFTAKYITREDAEVGHQSTIDRLLSGELAISIPLAHYSAWEATEDAS